MTENKSERALIVFFRLAMAWTFLYAASHQVFVPGWSVAGFLNSTKTFHGVYSVLTGPGIAAVLTFLVEYGHLLIGLSLLIGLMVRVSASFGIMLMLVYWTAHMDFPYISDTNNFLLDQHIVYAGVLRLPDRQACRPRLGARRLGREERLAQEPSGPQAAGRLTRQSPGWGRVRGVAARAAAPFSVCGSQPWWVACVR